MLQLAVFEDLGPGPALAGGLSPDASTLLFQTPSAEPNAADEGFFSFGRKKEGETAFLLSAPRHMPGLRPGGGGRERERERVRREERGSVGAMSEKI